MSSSTYMYLTKRQQNDSISINFNVNTVTCAPANITVSTKLMNVTTTTSGCYASINTSFYGNFIRVGDIYNITVTAPMHYDFYGTNYYMMSKNENVSINMMPKNTSNDTSISVTFLDEDSSAPLQYQYVSIYVNNMTYATLTTNQMG